jgi:mannose-6-phosphate isomerase-like protein (cupin superfamily)
MSERRFSLYDLNDKSGWILSSFKEKDNVYYSPLLQFGQTNLVDPWQDPNFHHHTVSLELYLLVKGEMWHIVNNIPIRMKGCSLLVVMPGVSHSVIGGRGKISHYGMKIPHSSDKKIIDESPKNLDILMKKVSSIKETINLNPSLGFYIDFNKKENQNRWILGYGEAMFETYVLSLAYMNFQTEADFKSDNHLNELHVHTKSTEWYLTIEGIQKLTVDHQEVSVKEGNLLRVNKNISHKLLYYSYPFKGVTIRTPNVSNDKVVLE